MQVSFARDFSHHTLLKGLRKYTFLITQGDWQRLPNILNINGETPQLELQWDIFVMTKWREQLIAEGHHLDLDQSCLRQMRPPATCRPATARYQEPMLWAAVTVCFFGFFQAGEITVRSSLAFDARVHFCWGDVAITDTGGVLWVFPKTRRPISMGEGNGGVHRGPTTNNLCLVEAVRAYVAHRGMAPGAFFCVEGKARFVELIYTCSPHSSGGTSCWILQTQFSYRSGDGGRSGQNTRFDHPSSRALDMLRLSGLHLDTYGAAGAVHPATSWPTYPMSHCGLC